MDSEARDTDKHETEETNNNEQSKKRRIQQRLKELGVSDDSTRPEKKWFSRYGNYLMVAIIVSLGVVYWLEYSSQRDLTESEVTTDKSTVKASSHQLVNNSSDASHPSRSEWFQKQAQHQQSMQKAWQQHQQRYQQWLTRQREQQARAWADWQNYIKQQQNNRQAFWGSYPAPQGTGYTSVPPVQPYQTYPGWQVPPVAQRPYTENPYYNR